MYRFATKKTFLTKGTAKQKICHYGKSTMPKNLNQTFFNLHMVSEQDQKRNRVFKARPTQLHSDPVVFGASVIIRKLAESSQNGGNYNHGHKFWNFSIN